MNFGGFSRDLFQGSSLLYNDLSAVNGVPKWQIRIMWRFVTVV